MAERLPAPVSNAGQAAKLTTGIGTALAALWFPPAALAQPIIDQLIERYTKRPERILIERLRAGNLEALTNEQLVEFVPMAYKFFEAAKEGEFEHNLRLLSEYLVNELKQPAPKAGNFSKIARKVEGMSEIELKVIALSDIAMKKMDENPPKEAYFVGRAFVAATTLASMNENEYFLDHRQIADALSDLAARGLLIPDGATRFNKNEEFYLRSGSFCDLVTRARTIL